MASSANGSAAVPTNTGEGKRIVPDMLASGASAAERVTSDIENLIDTQKAMRLERKRVAQELRNAQKKRSRLKQRARLLSTEDLLTVVALREKDLVAKSVSSQTPAQVSQQHIPDAEGEPVAPRELRSDLVESSQAERGDHDSE